VKWPVLALENESSLSLSALKWRRSDIEESNIG
jgi:hypothetical protein